jgi:Protein of unknown function (DUF3040)
VGIRDSGGGLRSYVREKGWQDVADDVATALVGVFAMSGLTDWERHQLSGLERQLTREDPRLAARLSTPADLRPAWARRRIGWLLVVVGLVLTSGGSALKDASTTLSGLLVLGCRWVPFWGAGRTVSVPLS